MVMWLRDKNGRLAFLRDSVAAASAKILHRDTALIKQEADCETDLFNPWGRATMSIQQAFAGSDYISEQGCSSNQLNQFAF